MDEFILRELKEGIIYGYHWPLADPEKVVCIIHGIGEYGGRYDRVAKRFNEAGFAVFSMDLRGHGKSLGKKGDCAPREEVLEDISTLISHGARSYRDCGLILYGHSMGGNIVLDYRRRGTFREIPAAYLISAPWISLVTHIPSPVFHTVKFVSHLLPTVTMGSDVNEDKLGNPRSVLPYHDDPNIHNRISLQCAVESFEIGKRLGEPNADTTGSDEIVAETPLLLLHGGDDRICDIEGTRSLYENCKRNGENVQFMELPGIYHEIHNGGRESNGDEVIDIMIDFCKKA